MLTSRKKSTPNSVRSLRAYWRDRMVPPDIAAIAAELRGESDRASVILMAALLDDALVFMISGKFLDLPNKNEAEYIFRPDGPLGSFSARAEISYLFGFIDEQAYGQLDDIREMRNACAHTKQPMSFSVAALANVAKRLCYPRGIWPLEDDTPHGIREAFIREAVIFHQIIIDGSRERGLATATKVMQDLLASLPPLPDKQPPL
jgi:hypothetical protein